MSGSASSREPNDLGVASAFDVEDALAGPAMLVVADEQALAVRAQRGLTRPREAEEERSLAGTWVDVRRRMEREDARQRKVVVHRREDGLLHLAGVGSPGDDDHPPAHVEEDAGAAVDAVVNAIKFERRGVENREARLFFVRELLSRYEHRAREEAVVGLFRNHANRPPVVRVLRDEQSWTYRSRPARWASTLATIRSNVSSSSGWLCWPHQTCSEMSGPLIMNLSLGERPVLSPLRTAKVPPSRSLPSPRRTMCS